MGLALREKKAEEQALLPVITRQMHTPIESLSRTATNTRLTSEGTYRNSAEADSACKVAANLAPLRLETLPQRFAKLVNAL